MRRQGRGGTHASLSCSWLQETSRLVYFHMSLPQVLLQEITSNSLFQSGRMNGRQEKKTKVSLAKKITFLVLVIPKIIKKRVGRPAFSHRETWAWCWHPRALHNLNYQLSACHTLLYELCLVMCGRHVVFPSTLWYSKYISR